MAIETKKLRAVEKRFERTPTYVAPYFDENQRLFYVGNQSYKSREVNGPNGYRYYEAVGTPMPITNIDQVPISSGIIISDAAGEFLLQMAKDRGYIASSKSEFNTAAKHRFYVVDEASEARDVAKRADMVLQALELLKGMTAKDLMDLALYLQLPVQEQPQVVVEARIKELVLRDPGAVLEAKNNRGFKAGALIEQAVNAGIIVLEGGRYSYGKMEIGTDRSTAIQYLMLPANNGLVREIINRLAVVEKETETTE